VVPEARWWDVHAFGAEHVVEGVGVFVVSVVEAARVDESVARVLAAKKTCD
jgi:hypothetical protein